MNKKSLILLLSIATSLAFADSVYYDALTKGSVFNVNNTSATTTILGNITTDYDGIKGATVTLESKPSSWGTVYAGEFKKDFIFENGVIIKNNREVDKGGNTFRFEIYNGKKLTFNSYMGFDCGNKTTHYGFFSMDSNRAKVEINTNLTLSDNGQSQMWFENKVDVTYNGTDNNGRFGYTHFKNDVTLKITKDLYIQVLDLRAAANDTFGNITIDNSTLVLHVFKANSSNSGDFTFTFANANAAETLVFESIYDEINTKGVDVIFEDFGTDDKIYSARDLTTLNNVTMNGASLSSLIENGTIKVSTEKDGTIDTYVYTMATVPEPSFYAVIFGAIALGFVAYSRKK